MPFPVPKVNNWLHGGTTVLGTYPLSLTMVLSQYCVSFWILNSSVISMMVDIPYLTHITAQDQLRDWQGAILKNLWTEQTKEKRQAVILALPLIS